MGKTARMEQRNSLWAYCVQSCVLATSSSPGKDGRRLHGGMHPKQSCACQKIRGLDLQLTMMIFIMLSKLFFA